MTVRLRRARCAAAEVAAHRGVDPAALVHLPGGTTSWVFDLPPDDTVLIVARPGRSPGDAAARVAAAEHLSSRVPFVAPASAPVCTSVGLLVTVWRRVPVRSGRPDPAALGRVVRALQEVEPSAIEARGLPLPDLQRVDDIVAQVRRQQEERIIGARHERLLTRCALALGDELDALAPHGSGARVVVHGDLHHGNVLATDDGCVLCDTDELGRASRDWDLAFLVDPGRRGRLAADERGRFEEGFGGPLPLEPAARTLARVAHLRRTVRLLDVPCPTARESWWNRVRLGCWAAMSEDWSRNEHPAFQLPRAVQAARVLRRAPSRP